MKKLYLFIVFVLLFLFAISCKTSINQKKKNISDGELIFTTKMALNNNIKNFLDEYFCDSILMRKMDYYFLVINQDRDSSILIITPIFIDFYRISEIEPKSFIKYNNKIIFVDSVIDRMIDVDINDNFIANIYKESLNKAGKQYRDSHYYKRWALVINIYDNKYRIMKDADEINQKISYQIVKKDTIIEDE